MPASKTQSLFLPARAKLWIGSLDVPKLELCAQYNPKELQIDKEIPWSDHKAKDNQQGPSRTDKSKQSDLEYNGAPKRTMTIELFFDGYESNRSVETDLDVLETLSTVRNPEATEDHLRRPHHCIIAWGAGQGAMRPLRCVINKLNKKYSMWNTLGIPLRATATVSVTEADRMEGSSATPQYGLKSRDPSWVKR